MTTDRLLKAIVIAGGLAALPISIGGANGIVGTNNAWCTDGQGGTCCSEYSAQCYPNSCSDPACMVDKHYWRTDGKPCSAPHD